MCPALARKSVELSFAWLLFGVAVAQYAVFEETGRTADFRNLHWGAIVALYILFVVSVAMLLDPRREGVSRRRDTIAWTAFALHVLSGVFVLIVFARTGSYWWDNWSQIWAHW